MATRQKSVFTSPTSPALFKPVSQTILSLENAYLDLYLNKLPTFPEILEKLQEQGLFKDKKPVEYSVKDFFAREFSTSLPELTLSPFQILAKPLSSAPISLDTLTEPEECEKAFDSLADEINCYFEILIDVLNNQLAQEPYEEVCDQENVTEQEHALQAGKIAYLLNMGLNRILAMTFHDSARPTSKDPTHGHLNHCKEGRDILAPLGLDIDYAGLHAFAKHLLYTFCPPYKDLISNASIHSLGIQSIDLASQLGELNNLDSEQLAETLYTIMFMRLIDDMSKVPVLELKKRLGDSEPDYFDNQLILKMLKKQMVSHLNNLAKNSTPIENTVEELKQKLDSALLLLLRARNQSNNSELYKKHQMLLEPLLSTYSDSDEPDENLKLF